jgi:hypothetical protein
MHLGWVLGSLSIIGYSSSQETEALIWIYGEIFLWISLYVLFLDATETVASDRSIVNCAQPSPMVEICCRCCYSISDLFSAVTFVNCLHEIEL